MRPSASRLVILVALAACTGGEPSGPGAGGELVAVDPPAAPGALAPHLAADGDGALLSWLEPVAAAGADAAAPQHRLRVARFDGRRWGEAGTVHAGPGFFANWADTPSVVVEADGRWLAHWLERLGDGTYAYGVRLAWSDDRGAGWSPPVWLHDDASATEHGFVSLVPGAGGALAVWLDGRAMAAGGAMSLRAGAAGEAPLAGQVLDDRVCECCATAAVATPDWALVAYRDRSEDEVRDIALVRGDALGWSEPYALAADGWRIPGCPVNGPALSASGHRVAAAWFTAAGGGPRVRAALSEDGGASFGAPVEVAAAGAVGRVGVALEPEGSALVGWIGALAGEAAGTGAPRGAVWLRRIAPGGAAGAPLPVAATSTARASGFPRLLVRGDEAWLAWVETGAPARLRFGRLPRSAVPGAPGAGR